MSKRLNPTNAQSWDYDAVGNWDSVTTNSTTQTRGANRQNEITSVSGATTPTYDNNGNLTKDENDNRFVWDAWNREVKIKNSSNTVIATNAYDGLNRKVQVTTSAGTIDEFFSNNWQVLEGKNGSNTQSRYVWSPAYVDGLVTRDRDTDANGTLDERLFALQDANWNVTGITNTSGTIQERYTETPYGAVTFRDGSGLTISVSTKGWDILHQGAKRDIIGDYDFRNRVYSPTLGRWLSNDPLGFEAGDANTFRYVGNGPGNKVDPMGKEPPNDQPLFSPEFTWGSKVKIGPNLIPKIEPPRNPIIKDLFPEMWGIWNDNYQNIKNGIDIGIDGNFGDQGNINLLPSPGNNPNGISSDFGGSFAIRNHSGSVFGNINDKGIGDFTGIIEGNADNEYLNMYYNLHMHHLPTFNYNNIGGTAGGVYRNGPIEAGGAFTFNGTNDWSIEAYLRYYREFLRGGGIGFGFNVRHDVQTGNQHSTTINGGVTGEW